MLSELRPIRSAQVSRCNVEHGLAAGLPFPAQAVCGPGICRNNRCSEFRVGVQLQAVFNHMSVLVIPSRAAGADNKTAMGNSINTKGFGEEEGGMRAALAGLGGEGEPWGCSPLPQKGSPSPPQFLSIPPISRSPGKLPSARRPCRRDRRDTPAARRPWAVWEPL